jgi:hypothetical protein
MHFNKFSFGALRIDGSTYEQDVVIGALLRLRISPQSQGLFGFPNN